ncbi:hypothetical protein K3X41_11820 [Aliiroseovarius crassostreae]|uniref:Uncharacterized protein n=1 Tax=Aliiroseovarius crassostreae TaxID=154981 RepID=A0A9Q9H8V8_9RHOB|nr:hypothetical protein [Aliiroseovarius crassostreae]UWP94881.1 hypothetical protein K3X48_11790 [Aliiroseovarius crassostreae]UWQ07469.1 hypothetical protein K3X25_11940 [Aliiroseovarius crassostreae]UWQ10575.1 hypothetical protein K3X41_11820 [Aliiroseovarius crassostreae]
MNWLIDAAAVMVIPAVLLSFWITSRRQEFAALRASGQKLNLRLATLYAGYQRPFGDPLRASHIRMARIGFLHWAMMLAGFMIVFVAGMSSLLLS